MTIDCTENEELNIIGVENLVIGDWVEGDLDCNLNKLGKTGMGELHSGTLDLL